MSVSDAGGGGWGLILGCSMGAGAAIARRAAADGLDVLGVHRGNHPGEAAALQAEVRALGRRCELLVADAGRLAHLDGLAPAVAELVGPAGLRLVVHSLADGSVGGIVHGPDGHGGLHQKQILKTFEVMAHSFLFWGQRLFHDGLLADGARVIALLNYLDSAVLKGGTAIGASKAALTTYVRYMASELGPLGVRVNGIRFGAADTYAASMVPDFDKALQAFASVNPLGRNVATEDVADLVSLLMDERARFVNGAILPLDGGEEAALIQRIFEG